MKDLKRLLKMVTIVVLAAVHMAESCNVMNIGDFFMTEYCVENDEEDEEEFFERMHSSDIRRARKIE